MARRCSDELMLDLHATVKSALKREGVVNVPAIALEIRERHSGEQVSVAELEGQVLATALALNATVLFNHPTSRSDETSTEARPRGAKTTA